MPAVRVSEDLFQEAKSEAEAMGRSVAGQLEYWARLGQAAEAAGLAAADVKALLHRRRAAHADRFASLLQDAAQGVYEGPGSAIRQAKQARQKADYEAQKAGMASVADMSPFAGARMSVKVRKVPLDD
jgi:hypothetical protein